MYFPFGAEAYALVPGGFEGTNDFGREAIEVLLARMENDRSTISVVAAGYTAEMERFLDSNVGLRSRFGNIITFANYDGPALLAVADAMATKSDFYWKDGERRLLAHAFIRLAAVPPKGWANGRSVRMLLDEAVTAQAGRLSEADFGDDEMSVLTEEDARNALAARFPSAAGP